MKKWLGRLAKIAFFVIAFLGVVITVLFNMGGDSDTLKGAIQDYISATTGYAARIQQFNKMTFFPNVSVNMEGIVLKKPDIAAMQAWANEESKKPEEEQGQIPPPVSFYQPDATIEQIILSVGFWDVGIGSGRKIKSLQVRNAAFDAGTLHYKPLFVETLGINETAQGEPYLDAQGQLGDDEFTAQIDLEASGSRSNRKYTLGEESDFNFNIGDLTITGVIRPRTMGGFHMRDLKVINNGQEALHATFSFVREQGGLIKIEGDFVTPEYGSNGEFDLDIQTNKNMQTNGEIDATLINQADFEEGSQLSNAWKEWNRIFKNPEKSLSDKSAIGLEAEKLISADETLEGYNGAIVINENTLTFKNIEQQ